MARHRGLFDSDERLQTAAARPGPHTQDPSDPGAEQPLGRPRRAPDRRPAVVHALPWAGALGKVQDAKTIWAFQERLTNAGAIEALFARLDRAIREASYIPMSGQIGDASLVSAPKQRNTVDEKKVIKGSRVPEGRKTKTAKLRRKDRDARCTLAFCKARLREDTGLCIRIIGIGRARVNTTPVNLTYNIRRLIPRGPSAAAMEETCGRQAVLY